NVTLVEVSDLLDEVVVVGYGTQKKTSLTGSVSALKGDQLRNVPTSNLTNALAGKLAGVTVAQTSGGRPGNSSEITIRARGTWNNTAPLYVIDGVIRDARAFDALNGSEVEDISILKDASAASIYGARAANGVILVTTKKGQSGKPIISYSGSVSMANATLIPNRETGLQHIQFVNDYEMEFNQVQKALPNVYKNGVDASEGYINGNVFTDDERAYYANHDYNLLDDAWRTPITTNHAVNVSGGNESVKYFAGATYYNEEGAFKSLKYDKYTIRGSIEAKLNKNWTASLSFNADNSVDHRPHSPGDGNVQDENNALSWLYNNFIKASHLIPSKVDGMYIGSGANLESGNPVAIADGAAGYINDKYYNTEYTTTLQYDVPWIKGLSAKMLYNNYKRHRYLKNYQQSYQTYSLEKEGTNNHIISDRLLTSRVQGGNPGLREKYENNNNYQLNGFITYSNTFGKHEVGAMLGFEQAEGDGEWFRADKLNFPLNNQPYFNFGSINREDYSIDGKGWENARLSYIGRANYAFDGKYLAEFSFRRDASIKFDERYRWGFFPTGSLAWRLSEESFIKDNAPAINNLKVRGSVGLTGNDAVDDWLWMDLAGAASGAYYGGTSVTQGYNIAKVGNPLITWEKSLNYNYGLDAGFLKNMFTVGFDYFFRHTYDILGSQTNEIPDTFGATLSDSNYGIVNSWGYELELGFNKQINKDLSVWVKGNFGFADNKLVEWAETGVPEHLSKIGKNWDRQYGFQTDGIVRTLTPNGDGTYNVVTSTGNTYTVANNYYTFKGANYNVDANNKYALRPGSMFYKDLGSQTGVDEDGKMTYSSELDGVISGDDADKAWIVDHYNPPYNFGLLLGGSWKGFSLEVFFQGLAGHKTFLGSVNAAQYGWDSSNWAFWSEDHYSTANNPNAMMPCPTNMGGLNMGGGGVLSSVDNPSFWVRDASFIRLKNVSLSYDIPKTALSKAGISQARIFVTGNNLALLYNPLKYYDPELAGTSNDPNPTASKPGLGIDSYPLMRTFTVGLNVSF
ncbi:TonB-dependent receptor SusC, partial [termite gut metagenome]